MAALSDKDMTGEKGNAIIEKINAVETSMLKLQQQSEATKAKIDKAMQADAEAEKLAEAARQAAEAVNKIPAVSYTHLDVYKRQAHNVHKGNIAGCG